MATTIVVGDGPAGLSAALFLAKNDENVIVFGEDETAMHYAYLYNYLGVDEVDGSEFQERAHAQVTSFGAQIRSGKVVRAEVDGDAFLVELEDGTRERGAYLVLAGGRSLRAIAESLGVSVRDGAVEIDMDGRTSVAGVYAVGRLARPHRSQAIISAGLGAAAALDILAQEEGRDVTDWDTPDDAD